MQLVGHVGRSRCRALQLAAGVRQIARLWAELFRLVNYSNLPRYIVVAVIYPTTHPADDLGSIDLPQAGFCVQITQRSKRVFDPQAA